MLETEEQFCRSLHLELYTTGSEHFIRRTDVELHVRDVELLLVVMFDLADLLLPVLMHDLPFGVPVVLVRREHVRRRYIRLTDTRMQHVRTCNGIIFDGRGNVVRILQVHRTLRQRQLLEVLRAELLDLYRRKDRAVRFGGQIDFVCWLLQV